MSMCHAAYPAVMLEAVPRADQLKAALAAALVMLPSASCSMTAPFLIDECPVLTLWPAPAHASMSLTGLALGAPQSAAGSRTKEWLGAVPCVTLGSACLDD